MFGFGEDWLVARITLLVPLWLSLAVHEWAHAACAFRLGDDTAARQGRMTLNPIAHIDPVGTLLLPLVGVPFGWAKPVPIEPLRFHRGVSMRTGVALTAAAGPLSNLVLAALATLLLVGLLLVAPEGAQGAGVALLEMVVFLNVLLALFNMLPVPPLDGSRVADSLLPGSLQGAWRSFSSLGPAPLIALFVLPALLGVPLLGWPIALLRDALAGLVSGLS